MTTRGGGGGGGTDRARGRRWLRCVGAVLVWATVGAPALAADEPGRIERIELKTETAATKVILMLSRPLAFDVHVLDGEAGKSAERLVLDFTDTTLAAEVTAPKKVDDGFVRQIRTGTPSPGTARVVLDLASNVTHAIEAYETPPHVTVTIATASDAAMPTAEGSAAPPAAKATADAVRRTAPTPRSTPTRRPQGKTPPHPRPVPTQRTKRSK